MSLLASKSLISELLSQQGGENDEYFTLPSTLLDSISAKMGEEVTTEYLQSAKQSDASLRIDQHNLQILKNQLEDQRDIARLNYLGLPFAGAWLVSVPVVSLGLHLQHAQLHLNIKLEPLNAHIMHIK